MLALCLTGGCAAIAERGGRLLDGSALAEKTLGVYRSVGRAAGEDREMGVRRVRNRWGEEYLALESRAFPQVELRTTAPDSAGEFRFLSLHYLGGSYEGWNEFSLELYGRGTAVFRGDTLTLRCGGGPIPGEITGGGIRHRDRRLTGEGALRELRARHERILALVQWMGGEAGERLFEGMGEFEARWKPLLPPDAEIRDWEEAVGWVYLMYYWDFFAGLFSGELLLLRDG